MAEQTEHFERVKAAAKGEDYNLRELYPEPQLPAERRVVGPHPLAEPKLALADYIESGTSPPPAVHREHLNFPWGMLMNDTLGDCGDAMTIHGFEAFHLDAATPVPPFQDQDAELLYEEVSGYVPDDPSTDNGTDNLQLTNYLRTDGVKCHANNSVHKIAGALYVDPTDDLSQRIAIWEFVALFRAVGLPVTAQQQSEWEVTDPSLQGDAAVGSWGYHDIPEISYDARTVRLISWGMDMLATWQFDKAYAVQGFVVVTKEMENLKGVSPSGVNWTRLNEDLKKLHSVPGS